MHATPDATLEGPIPASPKFGDTITFKVTSTLQLFVNVIAHQGDALVMNSWAAYFPHGTPGEFGLYSPIWKSGAAECIANLVSVDKQGRYHTVDSLTFEVDA